MSYAYSNNGLSFRAVDPDYKAQAGEVLFVDIATSAQLASVFPNYATGLASIAWASYQAQAQAALTESDKTILRCYENGVVVPAAWATYRKALRAIVAAATGDATQPLPTRPAYPSGT